ncbi:hypothetical protein B0H11DRAFT_1899562 [Mycena galericulata]|nr:hypothetical protein B0H11DRAFT_1899562 [Mycena galericulata]
MDTAFSPVVWGVFWEATVVREVGLEEKRWGGYILLSDYPTIKRKEVNAVSPHNILASSSMLDRVFKHQATSTSYISVHLNSGLRAGCRAGKQQSRSLSYLRNEVLSRLWVSDMHTPRNLHNNYGVEHRFPHYLFVVSDPAAYVLCTCLPAGSKVIANCGSHAVSFPLEARKAGAALDLISAVWSHHKTGDSHQPRFKQSCFGIEKDGTHVREFPVSIFLISALPRIVPPEFQS